MTPFTQIVMVQLILYNGPSNLFTAVTILVEQTSTGALMASESIQSTRLYHVPDALDYSVMTCEVSILLQSKHMYDSTVADLINIKGIVNPKMTILSSFTHPHVVPNLYAFLSSVEHKDNLMNVGNQTVDVAIDFHSIFFHTVEVNVWFKHQIFFYYLNLYLFTYV